MTNIIDFSKATLRRGRFMKYEGLINEIKNKNKNHHTYTETEIAEIATQILNNIDGYNEACSTPIIRIAKDFGFKTFQGELDDGKSGDIHINGKTKERYGFDKVILVNKEDEFFHQRFVVAHELGHYLFGYLGNANYDNTNITFDETYIKNMHDSAKEKTANIFAAEIMMPAKSFIHQYKVAEQEGNGNYVFILMYLSKFFQTSVNSIEKRILEVAL